MTSFSESLRLAAGISLQAGEQGFRVHRRAPWEAAPFDDALAERASAACTRQLMAGAFYAGFASQPVERTQGPERREPSLLRHIHSLAASYQTTHATPPTLRRAAERFRALGRDEVAARCLRVAQEESGHDRLALADLAALGLPAQALVERLRPPGSLALVALFTGFAESDAPIAVFGYAYALERAALFHTAESVAAVERVIPAGVKATRCLRVHSAVGSDARHVSESIEFIAALPAAERAAVARAAYETGRIMAPDSGYPGDAAVRALLESLAEERTVATQAQPQHH